MAASANADPACKAQSRSAKTFYYLREVTQYPQRAEMLQNQQQPIMRTGGRFLHCLNLHFLFASVIADLVLGEREQVPHQPYSRRLGAVRADPQSGPRDPLQRGGSSQHRGRSRGQERYHLLPARWVETTFSQMLFFLFEVVYSISMFLPSGDFLTQNVTQTSDK